MRKLVFLICLSLPFFSTAQLNTKENGITIDIGGGAAMHRIFNNVYTGRGGLSFEALIHLELRLKKGPLFYGLKFNHLNFATDDSDSSTRFAEAEEAILQFTTGYSFVERSKMNLYISPGLGVGSLSYHRQDTSGNDGIVRMHGFTGSLSLGWNYHFKGSFGIFIQTGLSYAVHKLFSFQVNGNDYDEFENRPLNEVVFTFRGWDAKIGLRYAFGKTETEQKKESVGF